MEKIKENDTNKKKRLEIAWASKSQNSTFQSYSTVMVVLVSLN